MQLLVCIINRTEQVPEILSRFMHAKISGTTVVDCKGALGVIGAADIEPPPIYGSLRQFLNPEQPAEKLLLTVLEDDKIQTAKDIVNDVVGGIEKPNTGIIFTVSLTSVEGLAQK